MICVENLFALKNVIVIRKLGFNIILSKYVRKHHVTKGVTKQHVIFIIVTQ